MYVGIVSVRNPVVHSDQPSDPNNPIQAQSWNLALESASQGADGSQLDSRVANFVLRQGGEPVSPWTDKKWYMSFGPFYNVGGRNSTAPGPAAFIDFYGKK
jgi:hypothetical protein